VLISPMIIPVVVSAVGIYYCFARVDLLNTLTGLVLAHTALGAPFVVITVTATLSGFDDNLMRAAASLGAGPVTAFFRVMLPVIAPGVASGALFAFVTSFDEVIVALFISGSEQRTLPRQMWSGVRESLSPTITAVATLLIVASIALLAGVQWLQRRAARAAAVSTGLGRSDARFAAAHRVGRSDPFACCAAASRARPRPPPSV